MDVFLVPAGGSRYELYCEVGDEPSAAEHDDRRDGWRHRLFDRFTSIVSRVEAARHDAAERRAAPQRRTLLRRTKDRVVCWLAEAIAEQRLLWHLRGQERVTGWFPDDLGESEASSTITRMLRADADRHLRWAVIDTAGLIVATLLTPIPGPNVLLYYFIFRAVGHYLSRRGATHGLADVQWQMRPASALTELREVIALEPDLRQRYVMDIGARLNLRYLAAFFERIAATSA